MAFSLTAWAETRYVSPDGLHVPPFTSWEEAATNIQDAIDVCATGDVVVVTNGTYGLGATVRVTNEVTLTSLNGRDTVVLDGSALTSTQDVVFLQFGTLDAITISNAPRHGVKSEYGAVYNSLITHSKANGIDSYTTPRLVTNSTLFITNTIVRKSGTNGIYTCAVDTRIEGCVIAESGGTGVSLRQNDTVAPIQVPRVSNFLIRASTVASNLNSGLILIFANYSAALPTVPVRIEDCLIEDNVGVRGAGISEGGGTSGDISSGVQISGCVIRRNTASGAGGGVYLHLNRAPSIRYSIIENNRGNDGGGISFAQMSNGSVKNCLVRSNVAKNEGGGVWGGSLYNNTIILNESASKGGGILLYNGGEARNCIVYYNNSLDGANIRTFDRPVSYCCSTPLITGAGNISNSPGIAGFRNWRLVPGSACLDVGSFSYAPDDYDLDGEPRIWGGGVDMGCDEFYPPGLGGPLAVVVESSTDRAVVGAEVSFQCDVDGRPESYVWEFTDGYTISNTPFVSHAFDTPGVHTARVTAWNVDDVASNSVSVEIFPGYTNYAAPSGLHVFPFTNQLDAATNIQDAIAANIPGGVVRVDDGVYAEGSTVFGSGLASRIAITNDLDVISLNGPERTLIVGQGPFGDGAVRCAYVGAKARLVGFTLTNGHTRATGDAERDQSGAGAWCESGGIVEDCLIEDNQAYLYGGGIKNGTVLNSRLQANRAVNGGGAHGAMLKQCTLSDNVATGLGGGMFGGTNENVLVASNQAQYGGGAAWATLNHATVVNNHASQSGGGIYRTVVSNSIIYFNTSGVDWPNYFNSVCRYSCTTPDPQAVGNITDDPLFVDAANGNYRLNRNSPAVDAAMVSALGIDLLGVPRPLAQNLDGIPAPDMGAYEYAAAVYVAPGGSHVWPFVSWETAANDLQSGVDAAVAMNVVFVSNGVYNTGGRVFSGALTNRVVVDKPVRVQAVNDHAITIIEGSGPIGEEAIRGVYLGTNASLVGFTVRGGATRAAGDAFADQSGGGVWCDTGALISNCVIEFCAANAFGGGVYGGRIVSSFLNANTAAQGGGLAHGTIDFCTIANNRAGDGGGVYGGTGQFSIVYFNEATGSGPNVLGGAWESCCTTPDPGGSGHVTGDPLFLATGDYRLAIESPCIDALSVAAPFPGDDLDGTLRPLDGDDDGTALLDIGAQEFIHPTADTDGDELSDYDEIYVHGTHPLLRDPDGDGQSDRDEVIAGMDPYDPASLFAITHMATETNAQVFFWPGRAQRLYTIVGTPGMGLVMTNRMEYADQPGMDGPMAFTNEFPATSDFFGVRVRWAP